MRFRFSAVFTAALTAVLIVFLWAPFTQLIGGALWQAGTHQPRLLWEILPLRPLQRSLFFNSVFLALLTGFLSALFGIWPALALTRGPKIMRPVVAFFCALPLVLPPTLMAMAWLEVSHRPPARAMAAFAAEKPLPINGVFVASPVLAFCFFPIAAFALAFAFQSLPGSSEEAAHLYGDGRQAIARFYWPLLRPAIFGAMGVCGAMAMWEMGACDLLDANTYSVEIYRALSAGGDDITAALRSVPMLLIGLLLLWPALRALRFYQQTDNFLRSDSLLNKAGFLALGLSFLIFAVAPCGPIYVYARQTGGLRIFGEVWSVNREELNNTILLSSLAAPLIAAIAFGAVTSWRFWSARWQKMALATGVLPLLFPPITLGVALIGFYNRDAFALVYGGLPNTGNDFFDVITGNIARYGMMLIGYAARFLPLALWILWEAARRVDQGLIEMSQNMGASPTRTQRSILWPLIFPACAATGILLWALCAGELTVSILVNQPGGQTLPKPLFNLMHIDEKDAVAALSLTLFGLCALIFMLGAAGFGLWRKIRR